MFGYLKADSSNGFGMMLAIIRPPIVLINLYLGLKFCL